MKSDLWNKIQKSKFIGRISKFIVVSELGGFYDFSICNFEFSDIAFRLGSATGRNGNNRGFLLPFSGS